MESIMPEHDVLSFAVVGHPNEGKSSVVSTLTERDDIRISSTPGETEYLTEYTVEADQMPLVRFLDTPGFQVPVKTLKWLSRRRTEEDVRSIAEAFEAEFSGRPAFVHDSRILHAVADTRGLLYVIDAGKPIGSDDLAEMEILRRLGKTRMAVINSKMDNPEYEEQWMVELNRHFNAVRRFNAREAAFTERIRLLDALRLTGQHWEQSLEKVIQVLELDRSSRMEQSVAVILSLVSDCMTKTMRVPLKDGENPEDVRTRIMPDYTGWLRKREAEAQKEFRRIFHHHHFELELGNDDLVIKDLFAKETWRVLGLSRRQLSTVSALAGAAAGAAVDLALGEITFGVFMAGGALLGGVSGLAGSRSLSRITMRVAGMNHQLGRQYIELGPPRGVQLAYILIDRALLYLDIVSRWAHAKREKADSENIAGILPVTRQWPRKDQAAVSRFASRLIRGKSVEKESRTVSDILSSVVSGGH